MIKQRSTLTETGRVWDKGWKESITLKTHYLLPWSWLISISGHSLPPPPRLLTLYPPTLTSPHPFLSLQPPPWRWQLFSMWPPPPATRAPLKLTDSATILLRLFRCQSQALPLSMFLFPYFNCPRVSFPVLATFSHCLHPSHSRLPHFSCHLPLKILWIPLSGEKILPPNSRTPTGLRN